MIRLGKSRMFVPLLAFVPLAMVTLSCCPLGELPFNLFSTPVPTCVVPDVTGMEQGVAESRLGELGLTTLRTE